MSTMGTRIRDKRLENHLTMQELADKLGVQASAVNKWEKGTVENIKRSTIKKMATIFNCTPTWLMGYEDTEAFQTGAKLSQLESDQELLDHCIMLQSLNARQKKLIYDQIEFFHFDEQE